MLMSAGKFLASAAILALMIQMARPPALSPQGAKGSPSEAAAIIKRLESMLSAQQPQRITIEERVVNAYFSGVLGGVASGPLAEYVKFKGVYFDFEENVVRVTMEQSYFGYAFFASADYSVSVKRGQLHASCLGGKLGHLHLPAWIIKYAGAAFNRLWGAMEREQSLLTRIGSMEVHSGHVEVISQGPAGG